jgi:hypothetical protein
MDSSTRRDITVARNKRCKPLVHAQATDSDPYICLVLAEANHSHAVKHKLQCQSSILEQAHRNLPNSLQSPALILATPISATSLTLSPPLTALQHIQPPPGRFNKSDNFVPTDSAAPDPPQTKTLLLPPRQETPSHAQSPLRVFRPSRAHRINREIRHIKVPSHVKYALNSVNSFRDAV